MHEVSIVAQLIEDINTIANENRLKNVSLVKVSIGKMRQVIPESFQFAFDTLKKNTIMEQAILDVCYENIEIRCEECGHTEIIEDHHFSCSRCESPKIKTINGRDIILLSIEGEQNGD